MWLKKIRKRKLQSVIIVLIVMVCAMLMTSSLVIMTSWQEPYQELVNECDSPHVKLYLYESTSENATLISNKFSAVEGVESAQILEYSYISKGVVIQTRTTSRPMDYFIDILQYNQELHQNVRILEGDLSNLSDKGCFIPATIANKENIVIGDNILLSDECSYTVEGVYTDPYNMSISFDTELIVKQMPKGYVHNFYVGIFTEDNVSGYEVLENYRLENNGILEGRGITLEERIANNQMTDRILGGILLAMSVVILLVSGFMIRFMVKNMLLSDNKSIAIYKTLGYQNKVIIGIYLKLYTSLVLVGGILGAFLSRFVSDEFTCITFENLGATASSSVLIAGVLCVTIIVLFVMLCVYLVVKKTKTIKPMEVFQQTIVKSSKKLKASKNIISFSPIKMALRIMNRDKKNTIIIVLTCMMSAYCVNFAATAFPMIQGMQEKNYYWIGFDKHDVSMESFVQEEFDETVKKLASMQEVSRIIKTTTDVLEVEGYQVKLAFDGKTGLQYVDDFHPELVLLDIMLPIVDGITICKKIRETKDIPIIMLSAKSGEMDKVVCLGIGADDYVTKPFSPLELVARVKAHLRRYETIRLNREDQKPNKGNLSIGRLTLNKESYSVFVDNKELELTAKEFEVLWFFASQKNQVFSKEQIYEGIWGRSEYGDISSVAVYIKRIREKLKEFELDYIKTIWGVGYKFVTVLPKG